MSKIKKLLFVVSLVICAFGNSCGQRADYTYDEYSENAETTLTYEIKPVEEEEVVTKNYYTVGQTSTLSIVEPISCHFQDKWYREGESFRMGLNGCSVCMCVDTDIRCNDDDCLEQMPEIVELEMKKEKNLTNLTTKEQLKLPEINTTIASLMPENHSESQESKDKKIDYDYAVYLDYDDNGTHIYVEVPKLNTCIYEGQSFREDEEFKSGPNGCLHCMCQNNEVNCKNIDCPYPVAAISFESRKNEEKIFINATSLSSLIQLAENNIKNVVEIENVEDMLNDIDSCEYD